MSNDTPTPLPTGTETNWRNRLIGIGAAGLLAAVVSIGATTTFASAQDAKADTPVPAEAVEAAAVDDGGIEDFFTQIEDLSDEELDEFLAGLDEAELDELFADDDFEEGDWDEDDWELSAEDEAVFEQFDQCLTDGGVDDEAIDAKIEADTMTEADWDALDAVFEGCEPILEGLSEDLQAELEAFEEDCDEYEDDEYEDGDVEEGATAHDAGA